MAAIAALKSSSLPIIDISPWLKPNTVGRNGGRRSTSAALHAACLSYGFFYLDVSTIVEEGEAEELARLAREFFALPQEEKDKLALANQDGARGYQRLKENVTNGKADNHEGIDFYRPVPEPDKTKPLWGENQWPTVSGFKEKYEAWIQKMKHLGMVTMEAMALGLGIQGDDWLELRSKVDDSFWVMRVIGYPPLPNDYDGFSCGAHKDYGCLTFLYADPTRDALQVFLRTSSNPENASANGLPQEQGSQKGMWISADPIPGCVVCNVGEMWEVWTNGLYKSTLHRVVHRGSNYRVSIPFFFEPNFDALISPLPQAVQLQADSYSEYYVNDAENQAIKRYEPVVYGEFLMKKVGGNFATKYSNDD